MSTNQILTAHDYVDANGRARWRATFTEVGSHHCDLAVHELDYGAPGEPMTPAPEEIAILSVKWDGCAHIGFRDPGLGRNWVHVCGAADMAEVLRMLQWAWNLCYEKMPEYQDEIDLARLDVVKEATDPTPQDHTNTAPPAAP